MTRRQRYIEFKSNRENIRRLSCGIETFDNMLDGGLATGLAIIGADTGVGKTTFAYNLLENMVMLNENVKGLFFTLELTEYDLIDKSLARLSYTNDNLEAHTTTEFKDYVVDNINDYFDIYEQYGNKIEIVDNMFDYGSIQGKINNFIASNPNSKLVIVVDYLQYIEYNDKPMEKERLDFIIKDLKNISKVNNIPIILISSKSRNWNSEDLHSFNGSGMIEFSGDYAMILKRNNLNQIELILLKYRHGKPNQRLLLNYNDEYAYFSDYLAFDTQENDFNF